MQLTFLYNGVRDVLPHVPQTQREAGVGGWSGDATFEACLFAFTVGRGVGGVLLIRCVAKRAVREYYSEGGERAPLSGFLGWRCCASESSESRSSERLGSSGSGCEQGTRTVRRISVQENYRLV